LVITQIFPKLFRSNYRNFESHWQTSNKFGASKALKNFVIVCSSFSSLSVKTIIVKNLTKKLKNAKTS